MKKEIYIDASALKESACLRKMGWKVVEGLVPAGGGFKTNYKAGYGTSFHKAMQHYYSNIEMDRQFLIEESVAKAVKHYEENFEEHISESKYEFRTSFHLELTLRNYFKRYQHDLIVPRNGNDGKPMVEIKFKMPLIERETFVLYFTGTIDLVANYAGQLCIIDHKTTAVAASKIEEYFNSYSLSVQGMAYVNNYYKLTGDILPLVINGIFIKKPTDAKPAETAEYRRSDLIEYQKDQLEEFERWYMSRVMYIVDNIERLEHCPEFSACEGRFSLCQYYNVCRLSPEIRKPFMNSYFKVEQYNPLLFQD